MASRLATCPPGSGLCSCSGRCSASRQPRSRACSTPPPQPSKSTLRRARARLDEVAPALERIIEPTGPRVLELLGQYIAGFENADTTALEKALRADAVIEMVGTRTWFSGRAACLRYLAHVIGSPGDWRMAPTLANGQPAAIVRYRDSAYLLGVLTVTPTGIAPQAGRYDPA